MKFLPDDVTAPCAAGESVFEVGRRAGVKIETSCVGKATCGLCRVKVLSGEAFLSPLSAAEKKHLGNVYFITRTRLSCQAVVGEGDVVVEVKRR